MDDAPPKYLSSIQPESYHRELESCQDSRLHVQAALQTTIQEHVDFGFKRRSQEYIQNIFSKHSQAAESTRESLISKKNFLNALQDLKIKLDDQELEELFKRVDVDESESLSLSEFENIVSQLSDLERWALSIPVHYLLADAVSCIDREGAHAMEKASNLTEQDVSVICNGITDGLRKIVGSKVFELKQAYDAMRASQSEQVAGAKFTVGTMSSGGPEDFHKGLEGRIGPVLVFQFIIIFMLN
jgi:hypothetical protein